MDINIYRRPGAEKFTTRWEIPKEDLFHMKQEDQEHFTQHVTEQLKREIVEKVVDLLQNGDYACGKIKKAKFAGAEGLGFQRNSVVMQEEMIFTPFIFCEHCELFVRDGQNRGFCIDRQKTVHITDGCTLGTERTEEEDGKTNHDNRL